MTMPSTPRSSIPNAFPRLSALVSFLLGVWALSGCAKKETNAFPNSEGWVSLFNGKDLTGWETKVDGASEIWTVKDGVIDCDPILNMDGDKNLWSTKSYKDFILHVEWRLKGLEGICQTPTVLPDGSYLLDDKGEQVVTPMPGADSGIYLRGTPNAQVNIWHWPIGSGEVYGYRNKQKDPVIRAGVTPKMKADKPVGEWNVFRIVMKGDRLTVDLNGERVINNAQLPGVPESGPLALQHHGGYDTEEKIWNGMSSIVQFRNIYLKEL